MGNREMPFEEFNGKCKKSKVYNSAMDSLRESMDGMSELLTGASDELQGVYDGLTEISKECDKVIREAKR